MAEAARRAVAAGRPAVVGRVIGLQGFSTLPADEMVAIDDAGFHGDLLGGPGRAALTPVATSLFGSPRLELVGVEIHGPEVKELGLSCGGRADVLLQPAAAVPDQFWAARAGRAPAALITLIDGPGAGPEAVGVGHQGEVWGGLAVLEPAALAGLVEEASSLLREGRTARRQIETPAGMALVEAWVPQPRIVVVGAGDIVAAITAQAGLLGWPVRATDAATEVDDLLEWAGATGALVVCSHDPHVDTPALAAGLRRPTPYLGAMGSRRTQSRRMERLVAEGFAEDELRRIHRPIGLDLGGRRAPEVALSIVAEILACHCGRDGGSLKDTTGPIHG